jgi:hypothetical protein
MAILLYLVATMCLATLLACGELQSRAMLSLPNPVSVLLFIPQAGMARDNRQVPTESFHRIRSQPKDSNALGCQLDGGFMQS